MWLSVCGFFFDEIAFLIRWIFLLLKIYYYRDKVHLWCLGPESRGGWCQRSGRDVVTVTFDILLGPEHGGGPSRFCWWGRDDPVTVSSGSPLRSESGNGWPLFWWGYIVSRSPLVHPSIWRVGMYRHSSSRGWVEPIVTCGSPLVLKMEVVIVLLWVDGGWDREEHHHSLFGSILSSRSKSVVLYFYRLKVNF